MENLILPDNPHIRHIGRWDKSNPGLYHSYWAGAYLKVQFTGKTIGIRLEKQASLLVNIDNRGDILVKNASGTVDLAPSLPARVHTLRVAAYFDGDEIVYSGLILGPGETILPPAETDVPIVEFIGDSVTAGSDIAQGIGASFGWLAGDAFCVEHTHICDPGIALVDGYGGQAFGMESAYGRLATPNYQQSPAWDFSAYTPAAVVVNLGSNDVYTKIAPELFQERYIKFMAALRETYPQAHIFAMRLFNGWLEQEVKAAVAARTEAGDAQVHYVDTAGWLEGYGTAVPTDYVLKNGPSVHPSSFGHLKAATRLAPLLASML